MIPLEDRTYEFSRKILVLCRELPQSQANRTITNQLIRSGTSIGANYCEAVGAISRQDFRNKIHICKKESHESTYWLKLLLEENKPSEKKIQDVLQEATELTLIFGKIVSTLKKSKEKFNN